MTPTSSDAANETAGWAAAELLARTFPNLWRRAAGHSWKHTIFWLALAIAGAVGLITSASLPPSSWAFQFLLVSPSVVAVTVGFVMTMWAAPETFVHVTMRFIRIGASLGRRVMVALSFVLSVVSLTLLGMASGSQQAGSSLGFYLVALLCAFIAIGFAKSTVADAPAIVTLTSASRGFRAGRTALLAWCLACVIAGTVVGAAMARVLSSASIWTSVTLALLGIFVTVFTQRHGELRRDMASITRDLATLHRELSAESCDERRLHEAASDIEAALAPQPRGLLSLARQELLAHELKVTLMYLLAESTHLRIGRPTPAEKALLDGSFSAAEIRGTAAAFAWSIRARLLGISR